MRPIAVHGHVLRQMGAIGNSSADRMEHIFTAIERKAPNKNRIVVRLNKYNYYISLFFILSSMTKSSFLPRKLGIFFGSFIFTLCILSVGYAAYTTMTPATSGQSLTATAWNTIVTNIDDLNARWARSGGNLAFTGGNVGIGTANP